MLQLDRLRELLDYNPLTGVFLWRVTRGRVVAGHRAGKVKRGYISIRIDGCDYRANRLAWFYMTGEWPGGYVDHKNRDRADDRFENLRESTHSQNNANSALRSISTTGFKGVYRKSRHCWGARISISGKYKHLGYFSSALDAHERYLEAAQNQFGEFARAA